MSEAAAAMSVTAPVSLLTCMSETSAVSGVRFAASSASDAAPDSSVPMYTA